MRCELMLLFDKFLFCIFQLAIDFQHLYPNEAQNLLAFWPEIRQYLEILSLDATISDPVGVDLVKSLKSEEGPLLDESKYLLFFTSISVTISIDL